MDSEHIWTFAVWFPPFYSRCGNDFAVSTYLLLDLWNIFFVFSWLFKRAQLQDLIIMRSLTGLWFHTACRVWVGIVRSNKATVKGSLLKCHHPSSKFWMWGGLSQVCGFFGRMGEELGGFRGFRVKRLLARSFYEGSQGARWGQGRSGDKAVPWVTRRLEKEEDMKTIIKESSCHTRKMSWKRYDSLPGDSQLE